MNKMEPLPKLINIFSPLSRLKFKMAATENTIFFVYSVLAILIFFLDYAKNMLYSLGNGSILFFDHQNVGFAPKFKCFCKLLAEISAILNLCGGQFEFYQYKKKAQ